MGTGEECLNRDVSELQGLAILAELADDARVLDGVTGYSKSCDPGDGCLDGEASELLKLMLLTSRMTFDQRALALHFETIVAIISAWLISFLGLSTTKTAESTSEVSEGFFGSGMSKVFFLRHRFSNCLIRVLAPCSASFNLASSSSC